MGCNFPFLHNFFFGFVQVGDQIIALNKKNFTNIKYSEVRYQLRMGFCNDDTT